MINYSTKWIELEAPTKKQTMEFTHYKALDDHVIVTFNDNSGAQPTIRADGYTTKEANDFYNTLKAAGWVVIKNTWA